MNKLRCILVLFILFAFTTCRNKQQEQELLGYFNKPKQAILTGQWLYNNTIWYSAELTINKDGEFRFYTQNCLGQNFTEGKWSKEGDIIVLSSSEAYNLKKQNKNRALLSPGDTTKIYFTHERFQLRNDTLFFVGQNNLLEKHEFSKQLSNQFPF
jgi:hypothetical protein